MRLSSLMGRGILPVLAGLALLELGTVARAGFVVEGRLPQATLSSGAREVEVERESLEERSTRRVASVRVAEHGEFRLTVDAEPGLFRLRVGQVQIPFVVDEGQTVTVTAAPGADGLKIDGGLHQSLFQEYETVRTGSLRRHVLAVREAIAKARAAGDQDQANRLVEDEVTGYQRHRRELIDFTLTRLGDSPVLYAASLRWEGDYRLPELAALVRAFVARRPALEISRRLEERIRGFEATAVGVVAPALSGLSPAGEPVALAGLRGRLVLVDFWASWCSPCRVENRHYRELYRIYRDRGFEILAVSVDHDGQAWRAAIAKDQATWLHLSDLTGWKTPLAARYQVTALPASFLLDAEGRIVAKDLRGPALAAELQRRLGSP